MIPVLSHFLLRKQRAWPQHRGGAGPIETVARRTHTPFRAVVRWGAED